jgi:hypothetical protein
MSSGRKYSYFEMLDYSKEPVREKNGYFLYLATCGEDSELHGISEIPGVMYADFAFHDSIELVAQEWNHITGDEAVGLDLAWEPDFTAVGHLHRLVERIEAQHIQKFCIHDGPCKHIVAFADYLNDHEDDRELFEEFFRDWFPGNMFEKLATIEDGPEDWISEENLRDWYDYALGPFKIICPLCGEEYEVDTVPQRNGISLFEWKPEGVRAYLEKNFGHECEIIVRATLAAAQ